MNVVRTGQTVAVGPLENLVASIVRTFGQNNANNNALVLDTLGNLRALEERHLKNVRVGTLDLAQKPPQVVVPAHFEAVIPATENRVARLQLQVGGGPAVAGAVFAGRHVADVVGEVRVDGAGLQRVCDLAHGGGRCLLVAGECPLYTRELVGQLRAVVAQPVSLLSGQVAAPVRDFHIALQEMGGDHGVGKLVADADRVLGAGGYLGRLVRSIGIGGALALRVGTGLET